MPSHSQTSCHNSYQSQPTYYASVAVVVVVQQALVAVEVDKGPVVDNFEPDIGSHHIEHQGSQPEGEEEQVPFSRDLLRFYERSWMGKFLVLHWDFDLSTNLFVSNCESSECLPLFTTVSLRWQEEEYHIQGW